MIPKTNKLSPAENKAAAKRMTISIILWVVATLLTLATAVYQRMTGPTHPQRGSFQLGDKQYNYKLARSHDGLGDAMISIPDPNPSCGGVLLYRRYRMNEDFTPIPLAREQGKLFAALPHQPPAGKLEYHITLVENGVKREIPARGNVVLRFTGAVPVLVLAPHILLMFLGMLFSARTGMEFLGEPGRLRRLSWYTFGMLLLGGMVLGPVMQQYAFGQAWTGIPLGWDLTDNKTLIAVIVWAIALWKLGLPRHSVTRAARWLTLVAAVITFIIFLIPHSMFGSELDYSKVDKGVPASRAIGQG
jgi:hypothetical protein